VNSKPVSVTIFSIMISIYLMLQILSLMKIPIIKEIALTMYLWSIGLVSDWLTRKQTFLLLLLAPIETVITMIQIWLSLKINNRIIELILSPYEIFIFFKVLPIIGITLGIYMAIFLIYLFEKYITLRFLDIKKRLGV